MKTYISIQIEIYIDRETLFPARMREKKSKYKQKCKEMKFGSSDRCVCLEEDEETEIDKPIQRKNSQKKNFLSEKSEDFNSFSFSFFSCFLVVFFFLV